MISRGLPQGPFLFRVGCHCQLGNIFNPFSRGFELGWDQPASAVMVLTPPSPGLALPGGSRGLEEEMEEMEDILPGFGRPWPGWRRLRRGFAPPLLMVRPGEPGAPPTSWTAG